MKSLPFITLAALLVAQPVCVFAQSPSPAASASPPAAAQAPGGGVELTPQEQETMRNATAMAQQDPKVLASIEEMRSAMKAARAAMEAKDTAIAPLLDKIEAGAAPGAQPPRLTPDEFMELGAARKAIAGTPEAAAWQQATADYRKAVESALLAADPAVGPILQKITAARVGALGGQTIKSSAASATQSASPSPAK